MPQRPEFLKPGQPVRLQAFLARSGISSRRGAEEMIAHGRVSVNGHEVTAMGTTVRPGVDRVAVDGEEVKVAPITWLALHKPRGFVTSRDDPFDRRTVYELLPEKFHGLFHVGRLDRDSEGILLLTNDGDLAHRLLHPSFGVTKEYDVVVTGKPSDAVLRSLVDGVELEDGVARADSAKLMGPAGNGLSRMKIVLREGKKREVRRMMDALGHPVRRLIRRRFGPITLAELPSGKYRIVAPEELTAGHGTRRSEAVDAAREPSRRARAADTGGDTPPKRTRTAPARPGAPKRPSRPTRDEAAPHAGAPKRTSRPTRDEAAPRAGAPKRTSRPTRDEAPPRAGAPKRPARPTRDEAAPRSSAPKRPARPARDEDAPRSSAPRRPTRPTRDEDAPRTGAPKRPSRPTRDEAAPRAGAPGRPARYTRDEDAPRTGAPKRPSRSTRDEDAPRTGAPKRPARPTRDEDAPRTGAPKRPARYTRDEAAPRAGAPKRPSRPTRDEAPARSAPKRAGRPVRDDAGPRPGGKGGPKSGGGKPGPKPGRPGRPAHATKPGRNTEGRRSSQKRGDDSGKAR